LNSVARFTGLRTGWFVFPALKCWAIFKLDRMGRPVEERREVWEQILSLDESIPAYRVARAEVSKRMAEVKVC
jgi:hypothetical protein